MGGYRDLHAGSNGAVLRLRGEHDNRRVSLVFAVYCYVRGGTYVDASILRGFHVLDNPETRLARHIEAASKYKL
jgi:hypothetical protein